MFDPRSRYRDIKDASFTLEDGRVVAYRRRRFLPPFDDLNMAGTVFAEPNERIDRLATRVIGDPQQYWQLCDANGVFEVQELVDEVPRPVRVAHPQFRTTR